MKLNQSEKNNDICSVRVRLALLPERVKHSDACKCAPQALAEGYVFVCPLVAVSLR